MRTFNYSEIENLKIDNETMRLIAKIQEYKGRQNLFLKQKPESLEKLVEIVKIQSTEASNKIEGIITTSTRIKQLMQSKTTPKTTDEQEIMGYRDILNIIHESHDYIPIKASYILQLHRDLYKYSEKSIGGMFKNTQNVIAQSEDDGTKTVLFTPLAPYETPTAIEFICDEFNKVISQDIVEPLILIPIFIIDFLCIHPFNDGNGRMSRLITTLLLYKSGYEVGKYISLEKKIEVNKSKYYDVLLETDKNWHDGTNNYLPFIKFILGIILSAYRDFEDRISYVEEKQSALDIVRNTINKKIGKFTKNDIVELAPNIGRASIENSLKKLVEEGIIIKHGKGKNTFYTRAN